MENKKVELPEELQKVLDGLGNTPLAEPELYKLIKSNPKLSDVFKKAAPNLKISEFPGLKVGTFIHEVKEKVTDFFDKKGSPKVTEATQDCEAPDFEQSEEIYYFIRDSASMSAEDYKKGEAKITRLIWKISGLKKGDLTEWEQELVRVQIQKAAIDNTHTALGVQVKN